MAADIGEILFVEILRMSQYPGSPFTGNLPQDLVMFFFIPTVFIIIFIWQLVHRMMAGGPKSLGLLLGIAFYLFIVFQGFFSVFALLTGPYFIFLIFIYGLLFYFVGHFGISHDKNIAEIERRAGLPRMQQRSEVSAEHLIGLEIALREKEDALRDAGKFNDQRLLPSIRDEIGTLRAEISITKPKLKRYPEEWARYQLLRKQHHL